ncbi:hypothetical protein DER44DRAFT_745159 [Fusarium oxysporum]|nr:hypothetical protein DER44DRAFT_745159 [Fusarium oxysporum]
MTLTQLSLQQNIGLHVDKFWIKGPTRLSESVNALFFPNGVLLVVWMEKGAYYPARFAEYCIVISLCDDRRSALENNTASRISLASAIGGVRETHDSYRAVFERFINLKEEKIDHLHRSMSRISYTISMGEYYRRNNTTDQQLPDSKDVAELRELAIELHLTTYIMFEWSSLYTRISQDIFTPALCEVQSFNSLATLISSIDLSSDRLKLRPAQQGQSTPRQNAPLLSRSSMPITTICTTYSADSNSYFSQSSASMAKDTLTLHKVAEFAEIELNKFHSENPDADLMRSVRLRKAR